MTFDKDPGIPKPASELGAPFGIGTENPVLEPDLAAKTEELLQGTKKKRPPDDNQGFHTIGSR